MKPAPAAPLTPEVQAWLDARCGSAAQRQDAEHLLHLLAQASGQAPQLLPGQIAGFGEYRYRHASGRQGDSCLLGMAVRGRELVVYLMSECADQASLLARLGPHRMGKACLYLRQLAGIDLDVLETLVRNCMAETLRLHPQAV